MAEGAPAGAPQFSGTDDDAQHFTHQPPPIEGLNFGSQSDAIDHASPPLNEGLQSPIELRRESGSESGSGSGSRERLHRTSLSHDDVGDDHEIRNTSPLASPPPTVADASAVPQTPVTPRRARFPSNAGELTRSYSAPKRRGTNLGLDGTKDEADPADAEKGVDDAAQQEVPNDTVHRGWWASFRRVFQNVSDEWGKTHQQDDVQNLMADIGLDIAFIDTVQGKTGKAGKKKKGHNRISSMVGASTMLARPGLGSRTGSAATVPTAASGTTTSDTSGTTTAVTSGTATPSALKKVLGSGINAGELRKQLKEWKKKAERDPEEAKFVQAKAELAHRRTLVLLIIYAFMAYGAPSHRIEEYTLQLLKKLDMEGRVNYTVGCTEISFINPIDPEDPFTRSAYTTLVKAQGLDIGACEVAFRLYKQVIHGQVSVEDATNALKKMVEDNSRTPYYSNIFIVPFYGFASALACLWAYGGWWLDMVPAFLLGSIVGFLQVIVATHNPLYSNVLEVTAALITSCGARAFSSIGPNQKYFCFGAIAESSITTILPGYIVLCGSLELQSRSITAGSTRLFYAVFYSLLLGYGMAVGSQVWLAIYPDAPATATCPRSIDVKWKILLVPSYLAVQAVLIRARPRQIPVQVIIGSAAYTVNYFVSQYATGQVANTASALTLGILGHLWARSRRAFAFAAVVAGIMVLVPSGLAAQGGLMTGLTTPLFNNATTSAESVYEQNIYQSFSVGAQMITVAVGLAVGLFMSALVVYPFGRKNNALFSF
ncbi:unnamed protein product [Discula destructiva]